MITLRDLRRALEQALTHTSNPAILRLPESEQTIEGLARAYLPRTIWRAWGSDESEDYPTLHDVNNAGSNRMGEEWASRRVLDLSDPGTAHAVLVVLALALGLDPGVGGLGVMWERFDRSEPCWILHTNGMHYFALSNAPSVAREPDPIKALALALLHIGLRS